MSIRDDNDEGRYSGRDRAPENLETIDPFDRQYWRLRDINDAVRSAETTHTIIDGLSATTFIVQTIRVRELGDYLFVQRADKNGTVRLAFPPKVTATIARQSGSVATRVRRKVAKNAAAERKAAGILSGFAAMSPTQKAAARRKAAATRARKSAKRAARKAAKA